MEIETDIITFGKRGQQFFELSPYHYRTFHLMGRNWRTLIHYWVASMFKDENMIDMICCIDTPEDVFRRMSKYGVHDLDKVDGRYIISGVVNKMSQNKDIKTVLLSTGSCHLVYDGLGYLAKDNRYGLLLEKLREKYNEQ